MKKINNYLKMRSIFLLVIILVFVNSEDPVKMSCNEKDSTGQCIENHNDQQSFPFQYENLFINQPKYNASSPLFNSTDYFDFEVGDKVFPILDEYKIIPFPKGRFIGRSQGNFLHFMHLAYTKKLPIYFTIDQLLYPFIENTNFFNMDFIEIGFKALMYHFLENIINYGVENKVNNDLVLYFGVGLSMIDDNYTLFEKEKCNEIKNEILNLDNNNSFTFNISMFGQNKTINKYSFVPITSLWKMSPELKQISDCLRWFQSILFNFENETKTIYSIGEIISKSNSSDTYIQIKEMTKYLFNEEQTTLNPLEIYNLLSKENIDINSNPYNFLKNKTKNINGLLSFSLNYTFSSKEAEELFIQERESITSLISYSFSLENWINYRLISGPKGRLFPSLFEFVDIAHRGTIMRNFTFDRYKGKNNTGKLYRFRDGVDMSIEFNETKDLIYSSYENESSKWEKTYENGFHYLLWLSGSREETSNITRSKKAFLTKKFNTLMGSYIHFKHDILLLEQFANVTPSKNEYDGEIVDIMFESNIPFYQQLKKNTEIYREKMKQFNIFTKEKVANVNKTLLDELNGELDELTEPILSACDKIIKGINKQYGYFENVLSEEELKSIFYYDKEKKEYKGWYADLFKGRSEGKLFEFDIYTSNFYSGRPIEKIKFPGAVVYAAMNYIEMGIVAKEDINTRTKKVMVFAGYSGNEYPHGWSDKINLDGLRKLIINRK